MSENNKKNTRTSRLGYRVLSGGACLYVYYIFFLKEVVSGRKEVRERERREE